jgi:hypothetical protein
MIRILTALADAAPNLTAPEVPVGGGISPQGIVLDAVVFVLGVLILGGLLVYIGKRIFIDERD